MKVKSYNFWKDTISMIEMLSEWNKNIRSGGRASLKKILIKIYQQSLFVKQQLQQLQENKLLIIFESMKKQELNCKNLFHIFKYIYIFFVGKNRCVFIKKREIIFLRRNGKNRQSQNYELFSKTICFKLRRERERDWNTKITIELKNKITKSYNNCHSKSLGLSWKKNGENIER